MDGVLIAPGYPGYADQNRQTRNSNSVVLTPSEMLQNGSSEGLEFGRPRNLSQAAQAEADRRAILQGQRH
jgi:hypothetical protein